MIRSLFRKIFHSQTKRFGFTFRQLKIRQEFFKRKFNKKDFPILGESEEDFDPEKVIVLRSKDRLPKKLSVSVAAVRELCLDPKTKRWHWPFNGADIVYPNIYLGDE